MAKQDKEEKKPKTPSIQKPAVKVREYSVNGYCDLIGAQSGIRFVANLKFKGGEKKSEKEWKESFKKKGLI